MNLIQSYHQIIFLLIGFILNAHNGICEDRFPPIPDGNTLVFDYANVLSSQDKQSISQVQSKILDEEEKSIVIITIKAMADFSSDPGSIESFAQRWFNQWGIGSQSNNTGILVLLSVNDRKARIELGEAWGKDWDNYCTIIMDDYMVPSFKQGNYSVGLIRGLDQLALMAQKGEDENAPQQSWFEKLYDNEMNEDAPVPIDVAFWVFFSGVACLFLGMFVLPRNNITVISCAILFIILAVAIWLTLLPLAFVMIITSGYRGFSGSSSRGGGFSGSFSDGSSGGVGATGSW